MKLIVGLGNPGIEYFNTRHNIGWMVVDHLASLNGAGNAATKFRGEFWLVGGASFGFALLKPHTWMNLSGLSVREVFDFYKLELEDVLIICDDVALPFAQTRIRARGSAGGHNGIASVIGALGALEVPRLKIGVGGAPKGGDLRNWVLGHFSKEENAEMPKLLDKAAEAVSIWLKEGIARAMNFANVKPKIEEQATENKISGDKN